MKIYKDLDFKEIIEERIAKDRVFKATSIELSKGGTPRFKVNNGYVTTNKKYVALSKELFAKRKMVINGKEQLVCYDIEHYLTSLDNQSVRALSELNIYKDLEFKVLTGRTIGKGDIFKVKSIEINQDGTPCFRVQSGYVTTNKDYVKLTNEFPLISLIIPIYNVEKYLKECLLSLQNQTYKNIEVIMVNDGSPDNSVIIAEDFKNTDSRFKLHTQENAGLSAARNTGIGLASGQYIWFIDSDDIISEKAVEIMVSNLQNTGSDFAVGCYRRINSSGVKKAGHWVVEAHSEPKNNLTLQESPEILVNATAWSKVVNYNFLIKNNLYFPVGVLYEDQLWSTKLYSSAHSFNILKDIVYDWRVRDDNSSITQQSKDVDNLDAILKAIQTSLIKFNELGLNNIAHERIVQVLSNNMREYISYLNHTDRSYMERLSDGIISISKDLPLSKWRDVPAHIAAIEWLLINKDFDRVEQFLKENALNTNTLVATIKNNKLILKVPFWNDPQVNFPNEVLQLKENQYNPNIQLRKAFWHNQNELHIEGWAYLPLVDPNEVESSAKLTLISDEKDTHQVQINLDHFQYPQLDRVSSHQINDYRKFGFKAKINIVSLNLHSNANYKLQFMLSVGSIQRFTDLTKVATWGAAGNLSSSTTTDEKCVRLIHKAEQPVLINIQTKKVLLNKLTLLKNNLLLNFKSEFKLKQLELNVLDNNRQSINKHYFEIIKNTNNKYEVHIDLNDFPLYEKVHWLIRAIDENKVSRVIDSNNIIQKPIVLKSVNSTEQLTIFNTEYGNLGMLNLKPTFHFTKLVQLKQSISLTGSLLGKIEGKITATLSDHRHSIECQITKQPGGKITLKIPYVFNKWGKINPLASGRYELNVKGETFNIKCSYALNILTKLPEWLEPEALILGNIEINPRSKNLTLIVHPAAALDQMGARNRYINIQQHQKLDDHLDHSAVFFRTYYGESTTCCALGIHKELYSRNLNLKLYWSVKDSSIEVPLGGIPVIEGSAMWYKLYSEAKYIIDNTHQPDFFEKKDGQIVIATFHGYPFKMCGIPYWKSHGFSNSRIESFLRRHDQWDYLLSPAPYASPILEEVFPSKSAKTLEIGYPRNDIFFSEKAKQMREKVRKILGIKANQKVILYAPTYRDNLTENEFKAKMVDFFDLEKITNKLDENSILLIRGHAINARVNERVSYKSKQVIDVTDYPEISELCLASDLAVLDYSSLRFDYCLTNNPMIFFVPDLEDYLGGIRGSLVPYEETAPGPLVKNINDLIYWIKNSDLINVKFIEQRNMFIQNYMPLEDGNASRRFVDQVFNTVG